MKICQILLSNGDGGLEKHVRELSLQLLSAGHELSVLGHRDFLKTLPAGIERYPVAANCGRLNPILNLHILSLLRQIQADIVHAQASKAVSVLSHVQRFIPSLTVGTVHNIKRRTRCYQQLDHVIAVSHQLSQAFGRDKCSVVYNGIELQSSEGSDLLAEFKLPVGKPTLLAVGRLVEAKGFDMLLNAVNGLDLNLLIVGNGPEQGALQQQAAQLDPATQVRLLGQRQDILALMMAADGVLISSRREGFSYVFGEALLSGCRVLATDVPVANEMLPADLITPVDDTAGFRQKLSHLLANREQWSDLMQAPFARARQTLTIQAMGQQTIAAYQQLLSQRPC